MTREELLKEIDGLINKAVELDESSDTFRKRLEGLMEKYESTPNTVDRTFTDDEINNMFIGSMQRIYKDLEEEAEYNKKREVYTRVEKEYNELYNKFGKLYEFLETPYTDVSPYQKGLMESQHVIMSSYLDILEKRMYALENNL